MDQKKMVKKNILECENVTKSYNNIKVIDGVSLQLKEKEIIAIMGPSGSGKTTFLKCLNLLNSPDSGEAFLMEQQFMHLGKPLFSLNEIRENIGFVFQEFNLFSNLTCLRNITLALEKVKKKSKKESKEMAFLIAEKLQIVDILHKYPDSISGGQAQRLSLARALVLQPQVLLLDEITSALDPLATMSAIHAIKEIRELGLNQQMSIILVTHYLNFAIEFSDRILFLHDGTFVEDHPANEFKENCKNEKAISFIKAANNLS